MSVKLRIKKNKETSSLYLDIHLNGRRRKEFLPELKLYNKPKTPQQKISNDTAMALAENIRAQRQLDFMHAENNSDVRFEQESPVYPYFERYLNRYSNKDVNKVKAMIAKLREVLPGNAKFRDINENVVADFKAHLEKSLTGSTAKAYFIKFRMVLRRAHVDRLCKYKVRDFEDTHFHIDDSLLQKETLEPEEIQLIAAHKAYNETVKLAFIFCCFTGFDFADMFELRWAHIKAAGIQKPREKTHNKRLLPIHETVKHILSQMNTGTDYVFQDIPGRHKRETSWSTCNKQLKRIIKLCGIKKHITWHCARHTFGTLAEGDDSVIAQLLGHKGTRQVRVYRRTRDERLRQAVDSLKAVKL